MVCLVLWCLYQPCPQSAISIVRCRLAIEGWIKDYSIIAIPGLKSEEWKGKIKFKQRMVLCGMIMGEQPEPATCTVCQLEQQQQAENPKAKQQQSGGEAEVVLLEHQLNYLELAIQTC